jgi:hypothetical protein
MSDEFKSEYGRLEAIYDNDIDSWRVYLHPDDSLELLWQDAKRILKHLRMEHTILIKRKGTPYYVVTWKKDNRTLR